MILRNDRMRQKAESIFRAGLEAVAPGRAVLSHLQRVGNELRFGTWKHSLAAGKILVLGAGKAAAPMAAAVEELLGDKIAGGVVVVKYGHGEPLKRIDLVEAGHPIPDDSGVRGADQLAELLSGLAAEDLVIFLISGGGSALLPAPAPGLTLGDKTAVTDLLLRSGAAIEEINAVRKHLSRLKGGSLARLAAPAQVVSLILSDVVGDRLDVIASGPTAADESTFQTAWEVLGRYALREKLPPRVRRHLERGLAGEIPDTPKPGDPLFDRVRNLLVGNNFRALSAAAVEAQALGFEPLILSATMTGETRHVAAVHAAIAREVLASGNPRPAPLCLLSGGETTVTVRGSGKGGRNQEFALAAAIEIAELPGVTLLSAGTDGTDGPTEAAGAFAAGTTLARARRQGLDPRRALDDNDAFPFFEALGDLFVTGPTRTNVMDLRIVLVEPRESGR